MNMNDLCLKDAECCRSDSFLDDPEIKAVIEMFNMLIKAVDEDGKFGPEGETVILDEIIKIAEQRRQDVINECLDAMAEAEAELYNEFLDNDDPCCNSKCPSCPNCLE